MTADRANATCGIPDLEEKCAFGFCLSKNSKDNSEKA